LKYLLKLAKLLAGYEGAPVLCYLYRDKQMIKVEDITKIPLSLPEFPEASPKTKNEGMMMMPQLKPRAATSLA
jgi:hypothetical protein